MAGLARLVTAVVVLALAPGVASARSVIPLIALSCPAGCRSGRLEVSAAPWFRVASFDAPKGGIARTRVKLPASLRAQARRGSRPAVRIRASLVQPDGTELARQVRVRLVR